MNRLRIRHVTGFEYDGEAATSYNEARMLPMTSEDQFVIAAQLDISPLSSSHGFVDYWGTRVTSFDVLVPHRDLTLAATSTVEVRAPQSPAIGLDWDRLATVARHRAVTVEQLEQTWLTAPPAEVVAIAASIAGRHRTPDAAARAICLAIGDAIEYMPGVTGVHSSAADAWSHRKGVCQDIAHLTLGALRSVGIPARYVSGYLHPKPSAEIGEPVVGESHAWVEWFAGTGWTAFDPTNGHAVADWHVRVGRGRDYSDIAPLRGVYAGPGSSRLFVSVEITREA